MRQVQIRITREGENYPEKRVAEAWRGEGKGATEASINIKGF